MNKRIAKKRYKRAVEMMKTSRKTGIGVMITNSIPVDKTGKPCEDHKKVAGTIILKRPKIQYFKSKN